MSEKNTTDLKPLPVKSHNLRMAFLSVLILVSGIVIGSAGTMLMSQKKTVIKRPAFHPKMAGAMIRKIGERLDLSDEQHEKVKPIIRSTMVRLRKIQESAQPLIKHEITQMKTQISAELTEEQKVVWKKHVRRIEKNFKPGRGGGRGGKGKQDGDGRRPRKRQGGPGVRMGPGDRERMHRRRRPDEPMPHEMHRPPIHEPNMP